MKQACLLFLALAPGFLLAQNVGIGTNAPEAKLHIVGGTDASVISNGFMLIGASTAANLVLDNNEILARNNGQVSTLFLGRDGSMVQIGNGNLTPGTKLYVTSGSNLGLSNDLSGFMVLGSVSGTNLVMDNDEIQTRSNGAAARLLLNYHGGNVHIGNFAFSSGHRLGVTGDAVITGNLRIGETPLPSGYSFGVDGKMICTEVMVRLVSAWPDYVFADQYRLKRLQEVEDFIRKNRHLPGIPSAADVAGNGLSLGEMQRLQLEKIEELTLYVIDLQKQIDQLKKAQH